VPRAPEDAEYVEGQEECAAVDDEEAKDAKPTSAPKGEADKGNDQQADQQVNKDGLEIRWPVHTLSLYGEARAFADASNDRGSIAIGL
jgi:hypothetical protein